MQVHLCWIKVDGTRESSTQSFDFFQKAINAAQAVFVSGKSSYIRADLFDPATGKKLGEVPIHSEETAQTEGGALRRKLSIRLAIP